MKETIEPMETILFTTLSEQLLADSYVSTIMYMFEVVAYQNLLNLNNRQDYNKARKIMYNSVKQN